MFPVTPGPLDSRFEVRHAASGAAVLVRRGEAWSAGVAASGGGAAASSSGGNPAPSAAPSSARAGAGSGSDVAAPASRVYKVSEFSLEERYRIARSVGEECVQEEELMALLKARPHPVCYDGFEPSGRMHIAQGGVFFLFFNDKHSRDSA